MLPDRSKRYAGIDGEIPRLMLASNWQLAMVALLVLALLALIYPRNVLVEKLYEQESLDALTLSYIRNLYRADHKNIDAAILLTKAEHHALDLSTIESRLLPWIDVPDPRQRTSAWFMLIRAYQKAMAATPAPAERERLVDRSTRILQRASVEALPEPLARFFSAAAFEMRLPRLGLAFLAQVGETQPIQTLERQGDTALGRGDFEGAAGLFLMARDLSHDRAQARRLFQKGIGTLMAASRFKKAMQAAQSHLGDLTDDPATLRYLIKTAQAAGEPVRAADYGRRLVFPAPPAREHP